MHYKVVTVARLILEEVRIENRNRNVDRYIAMYIDRWINTYQKSLCIYEFIHNEFSIQDESISANPELRQTFLLILEALESIDLNR